MQWGNYGHRIKQIRAIVAKFPLNDLTENKDYDVAECPYGFEQ